MHSPTPAAPDAGTSGADRPSGGLAFGFGAYAIWGLFPLYVRAVKEVPGLELVSWRLVLAVPICIVMVFALRQAGQVRAAFSNGRLLATLALSAVLISANWIIFILAVLHGHVLATSLGYYINPLVNVLLGTVFLHERLSRWQWLAVGVAGVAVAMLAWEALPMLGISLSLGISFAAYGLVRKIAPVSAMAGLTVETILLFPLGIGYLLLAANAPAGLVFGDETATTALLLGAGFLTAIPLFLFAEAARRLDLSTLGFLQYLTPTLTFLQGLFLFHEPLRPLQLACFALIWLAIGIFSWDLYARRPRSAVR
ncbi:MAG: EamA family transporter RarD [Pseudomonadota bacterium]